MTIDPIPEDDESLVDGMLDDSVEDSEQLELAAAAVLLAGFDVEEKAPLPEALLARIERDGLNYLASREASRTPLPIRKRFFSERLGWWAAAASIGFALWSFPRPKPVEPPRSLSIEASLQGSPSSKFENADHPLGRGAGGKVVWNGDRQEGYLAIEGLAPVDRRKGIYQLWIFDSQRDKRYPVDGGTFSIDRPGGTTVIPIHLAVEVREPTLFAVTLEPPGGVVVSDRQRLLLTAAWAGGSNE